MVRIKHESMRKEQTSHKNEHNTLMCFPLEPVFTRDKRRLPNFIDEPAAGLDVVARNDFYRLLIEEYTQSGRTFVISTHIIDEASDIFEEVIIVNNQKIALKENTAELLERAYHISGNKEDVDKMLTQNSDIEVLDTQNLGRSKGISILTAKNKCLTATEKLSVQPMTLQNLFVAICEEGR